MMQVSEELAATNVRRYQDFTLPFTYRNARAAVLAFDGEVYRGLDAPARFDARDFTEAQKTVRILSGLYGILRPLDLIQPYRLEMGVTLPTERGATLYQWWDTRLTDLLVEDLHASPGPAVLLNLASVQPRDLATIRAGHGGWRYPPGLVRGQTGARTHDSVGRAAAGPIGARTAAVRPRGLPVRPRPVHCRHAGVRSRTRCTRGRVNAQSISVRDQVATHCFGTDFSLSEVCGWVASQLFRQLPPE